MMDPRIERLAIRIAVSLLFATAALAQPADGLAASAKENFKWYCVQCHGPEGKGDGINSVDELPVGPMNLTKAKNMKKFGNEDIIKTITQGGPANSLESLMPTWGNTLTKAEIKALMKFVRGLCKTPDCPK